MMKVTTILSVLMIALFAFAQEGDHKKVAVVKVVRGRADIIGPEGKETLAKKGHWVSQGSVIKTSEKSFVRLSFIDKSTVNVGPKTQMKIEKFSSNDAGVLSVLTGKIRSQITKDYLEIDKGKSKLYVKSKQAVMGVRGTDFAFAVAKNTGATTAILFEGSIAMNKIENLNKKLPLEDIINKGHIIKPGEFAVARHDMRKMTRPAKLSRRQLSAMKRNQNFIHAQSDSKVKTHKSIVPAGLSGDIVTNDNSSLEHGVEKLVKKDLKSRVKKLSREEIKKSKGFVKGDEIQPPAGSIVHIDSGTIIPIPKDSVFDKTNAEWVSNSIGGVDKSGTYVPPQGYKMTDEGDLLKVVDGGKVKKVILKVRPVDEVPALNDMQTIEFKKTINGPTPAGDKVIPSGTKNESDDILAPPPIPTGNTFVPPSYYTSDPRGNKKLYNPRTPIKIQMQRGSN